MGQINLSGSITAGPTSGNGGVFPGASMVVPLGFAQNPKGYQRATGILERSLALGVYTDLGEPGNTVTQATFLYLRSDAVIDLRLTTDDGVGGNVISVVPVHGLAMFEFPSTKYLKTLEALGTGKVEYFLSGQQ